MGARDISDIARQAWPGTRHFPPNAYDGLSGQARLESRQAEKLLEPRKETVGRWTDMRLAGKYDGLANARAPARAAEIVSSRSEKGRRLSISPARKARWVGEWVQT